MSRQPLQRDFANVPAPYDAKEYDSILYEADDFTIPLPEVVGKSSVEKPLPKSAFPSYFAAGACGTSTTISSEDGPLATSGDQYVLWL